MPVVPHFQSGTPAGPAKPPPDHTHTHTLMAGIMTDVHTHTPPAHRTELFAVPLRGRVAARQWKRTSLAWPGAAGLPRLLKFRRASALPRPNCWDPRLAGLAPYLIPEGVQQPADSIDSRREVRGWTLGGQPSLFVIYSVVYILGSSRSVGCRHISFVWIHHPLLCFASLCFALPAASSPPHATGIRPWHRRDSVTSRPAWFYKDSPPLRRCSILPGNRPSTPGWDMRRRLDTGGRE
jgi:hypothetical protein